MNEDHTLEEESPTQLGYTLLYYTFGLVMFILLVTDNIKRLQIGSNLKTAKCFQSVKKKLPTYEVR